MLVVAREAMATFPLGESRGRDSILAFCFRRRRAHHPVANLLVKVPAPIAKIGAVVLTICCPALAVAVAQFTASGAVAIVIIEAAG